MTDKPEHQPSADETPDMFPDIPPRLDMQSAIHLLMDEHPGMLIRHFGQRDTTLVACRAPIGWRPCPEPRAVDLLVTLNVDAAAAFARNGYGIEELGKPPDFVLEIALKVTDWNREILKGQDTSPFPDYRGKLRDYAAFGVYEYWRLDPEEGLAGDRLVDGTYQPIKITHSDAEHQWGRSKALNLSVCWEKGKLRWWNPETGSYLLTFEEMHYARIAAEARIRELEEELSRRGSPAGRE